MYVIAVTGGMGSGKSVACERFREHGAVVLDLDQIAHQAIEPAGPAYDRLVERFGPQIVDADGRVIHSALADRAFADQEALTDLNRIVHPAVLKEVVEGITSLRLMERPPQVVVLEVPLLAEAPVFSDVADTVLSIEAPSDIRLKRSVDAGMDALDASRRIARQATDEERSVLAQHSIVNDSTLEEFLDRLDDYWDEVAPRGT